MGSTVEEASTETYDTSRDVGVGFAGGTLVGARVSGITRVRGKVTVKFILRVMVRIWVRVRVWARDRRSTRQSLSSFVFFGVSWLFHS